MKKALTALLALGLIAGALNVPAAAKAKAKATPTTFYLHGSEDVGEVEAQNAGSGVFMPADTTKPDASTPKSMNVTNYLVGPNTACSGNSLLPTWRARLAGTVKGDLTLSLNTVAGPASTIQADIFPDGAGGCDSDLGSTGFVPAVASAQVDVPPGPGVTEIKFSGVNFKAVGSVVIMLSVPGAPANPSQVRVLYDGAGYESSMTLTCTPAKGSKSCVPSA
jgi:hypothetical protein